jgi:hypothetical protein
MEQGALNWLERETKSMLGIVKSLYLDTIDEFEESGLLNDERKKQQSFTEDSIRALERKYDELLRTINYYDQIDCVEGAERTILIHWGSFSELYNDALNHLDKLDEHVFRTTEEQD